jgi:hypothetical protein
MAVGTLERLMKAKEEDSPTVLKTVYNGNLKVINVPHNKYPNGIGPDGEEEYLSGAVLYKLSKIFRYMLDNKINVFDFNEFDNIN